MSITKFVLASCFSLLAVPALEARDEEAKAASPQCGAGIVYDDSSFEGFYSLGPDLSDATLVSRFDLPAGTASLDQVCVCFSRQSSSPATAGLQIVVYDDNGGGGQPGTLLGAVNATFTDIPIIPSTRIYSVSLAGSGIALPDSSVYIGARWGGGGVVMCGDRSAATPRRDAYGSLNNGNFWSDVRTLFANPPRALGIRADPATPPSSPCTPSATALCLNGGRFKVEATYQTSAGASGAAQAVPLTNDTGYFWFFAASNVETVVKVLDGCGLNDRYWFFAGGLTNVRTVLRVTDTGTGAVKTYVNPQNTAFQPIQDTAAFRTCP